MAGAIAVLSYTRKDDEFFNNYITNFREMLQGAVQVVTGTKDFHVFQDVEDIRPGEPWQKKLADVVSAADCFVPMLTPLFFNSPYCRMEVDLFLAHERQMKRDDLMVPVYFLSSAKLEKDEEKAKDPLAVELANRQMFDWRKTADLPLHEPAARRAMLTLGEAVAAAVDRLRTAPPPPRESVATRTERFLSPGTDAGSLPGEMTRRETLSARVILWVDDSPDNNVWERRALESYGVRFTLARDTAQAQKWIRDGGPFDAVISDLSRPGDRRAGYTLLAHVRAARMRTPYFIYSSSRAPKRVREAMELGATGLTNDPDELVAMIMAAIR